LAGPLVTNRHDSVLEDSCLEPFLGQAEDARVSNPMLQEASQPFSVDLIKEALDVNLEYPVHLGAGDPDYQRIQRIMLAAFGSEPIRETEEVFLVDCVGSARSAQKASEERRDFDLQQVAPGDGAK
jgi:hypothetical protein